LVLLNGLFQLFDVHLEPLSLLLEQL
jgi:hypothetical protein